MAAPGDYLKRTTVRPWRQHAASPEKIALALRNALALSPAATTRALRPMPPGCRAAGRDGSPRRPARLGTFLARFVI